ncbi:MAG: integrase [Gammaproteobacteria bacterium RIFCSPHIGHO2_12_FULL_38_11]|nr:MAG: integrase [Gammaproteobacteria bacterium RIFCSPHIGHO2_12_FULL_38_11]
MNSKQPYIPQAIFDSIEFLKYDGHPAHLDIKFNEDFKRGKQFLLSYKNNDATFNSFRREIERFAQYCWFMLKKNMREMKRDDIEEYLLFCQKPPTLWIGNQSVPRFVVNRDGLRIPNKKWRPFLVSVSKSERKDGKTPNRRDYQLSEKAFREIFTILNCYYNFLIQQDFAEINPILQIKQKNRFYRSDQTKTKIRRISELQWKTVIETAERMAKENPDKHERTLFIISLLYGMYLRISELVSSPRWTPTMNDFAKDHDKNWWFTTAGKDNKERQIAASPSILSALKRWRAHLKLSPTLPLPNDNAPLIPAMRGNNAVTDTSHIRKIMQDCFDEAIFTLRKKKLEEDAQELSQATVHWLRHTGISDDIKIRPREHVRDDAGHSSSSITDKYIDISLKERHASAKKKILRPIDI